jgi:hypothetical protein
VDGPCEFLGKEAMNAPLTVYGGLSGEGGRHHGEVEVGLAAGTGARMAGMQGRLVHDLQTARLEVCGELVADRIGHLAHGVQGPADIDRCQFLK